MKTIKAIIIDDEPLAHSVILKYEQDIPFLEIIGQCYLATEAYDVLNEKEVDLIFLDINMPIIKGLDFLRTLTMTPEIIITSAYEEYALEGFELQVTDYLLKPFRFDRFIRAINLVQSKINQDDKPKEHLFIKVDKKQLQIEFASIQYFESYGNYVKVWVNDKFHLTPRTLTSFESEVDSGFQRIHKSFIVQKSFIHSVEGNRMTMSNGNIITVGKNYRGLVRQLFR